MTSRLEDTVRLFQEVLDRSQTFLLSGHVNIDGDSLGSMLAMHYFLLQRGKKVLSLAFEPLLERYEFLGAEDVLEVFDPTRHAEAARGSDCFIMFDFSNTGRMPGLWELVQQGAAYKVCVDHHQADHLPGDLNVHLPTAPATGKIVLEMIRLLGGQIDGKIAEALVVAISTDTGWFRYSNTDPSVLRDAADLLSVDGLNASEIYRQVYQRNEVPLIRLMGRVAASMHEELDGRLLWATIPLALVEELGVGTFETDELLDLMRTGRDAECVALLRELPGQQIRVNLRSRGQVDVSDLARELGGGGHIHSAGTTMEASLDEASARVIGRLREAIRLRFPSGAAAQSGAASSP